MPGWEHHYPYVVSVKVVDMGWNDILREVKRSKGREVAVGILTGSVNAEGENIAAYASKNEFGSGNVPSRPFMRIAFDENVDKIGQDFVAQAKQVYTGKRTADQALTVIGIKHADRIKNVITGRDIPPELSPVTVAKKGSTKTLVDTGAMVSAVQISVRGRR